MGKKLSNKRIEFSVVVPVKNEKENLGKLYNKVRYVLSRMNKTFEMIIVDDGSTDGTWSEITKLHNFDPRVKGISFQKNFKKSAALSAGFKEAKGKYIITMDGDLQDDPAEIPKFYAKLQKGYDIVIGWKYIRHDPITKTFPSKIFNWLVRKLLKLKTHDADCGFKMFKKEIIDHLYLYGDHYRYIPALAHNKGFKLGEVKVKHHPRKFGKTKYGFSRLFTGTFDLITIKFLISYFRRPLHFFGMIGLIFSLLGFLAGLYLLFVKFVFGQAIANRPLLLLAILLIVLGVQFISLGLIGEMIANVKKEEKYYVIKEKLI